MTVAEQRFLEALASVEGALGLSPRSTDSVFLSKLHHFVRMTAPGVDAAFAEAIRPILEALATAGHEDLAGRLVDMAMAAKGMWRSSNALN